MDGQNRAPGPLRRLRKQVSDSLGPLPTRLADALRRLRRRIAGSRYVVWAGAYLLAGYIWLAFRTTRWTRTGYGPMDDLAGNGESVICALWHERIAMSPYLFDASRGKICSLTSPSRIGRLMGLVQTLFGFETLSLASHGGAISTLRGILSRLKSGTSVGIAVDGPRGPAREAKTAPLQWARTSGRRVFVVAWSAKRAFRIRTWDRMLIPAPFSRGVLLCREFGEDVLRNPGAAEIETLRLELARFMDEVTDEADRLAGFGK